MIDGLIDWFRGSAAVAVDTPGPPSGAAPASPRGAGAASPEAEAGAAPPSGVAAAAPPSGAPAEGAAGAAGTEEGAPPLLEAVSNLCCLLYSSSYIL